MSGWRECRGFGSAADGQVNLYIACYPKIEPQAAAGKAKKIVKKHAATNAASKATPNLPVKEVSELLEKQMEKLFESWSMCLSRWVRARNQKCWRC